jgi:hypothetical protein
VALWIIPLAFAVVALALALRLSGAQEDSEAREVSMEEFEKVDGIKQYDND